MFVCVCNAVTDREVRAAVDAGARSRSEVTSMCGAGGDCGSCHHMIEEMIEDRLEAEVGASSAPSSAPGLVAPERLVRTPNERAA